MRTMRRFMVLALLAGGCRSAPPVPVRSQAPPRGSPPTLELASGVVPPFSVPVRAANFDPTQVSAEARFAEPPGFLPLMEEQCRREAAARAPLAAVTSPSEEGCVSWQDQLVAVDRNRAALAALEAYWQLADADGRGAELRITLPILDRLRASVDAARAAGARVPAEPDDLDRQRVALLALLGQATLGAELLDLDLKRRVGVAGAVRERLRPVGPFPDVVSPPSDVAPLVQIALETRPDLRLLRTAYHTLSADTLPDVRELLEQRGVPEVGPLRPGRRAAREAAERAAANIQAEIELRRAQLFELITLRERQAADEVRAATASLAAQTTQVELAQWRANQLAQKLTQAPDAGPLARLAAEIEAARARADVIAAVSTWHQNRVKLLAAQGLLAGE